MTDILEKIGIAVLSVCLGAFVTAVVTRQQNRRRDRGIFAQVRGLLSAVEERIESAKASKSAFTTAHLRALDDLFKAASSTDVSIALAAGGTEPTRLYGALIELRARCEALTVIQTEFEQFTNLVRRGGYHQTSEARAAEFRRRFFEAADAALAQIEAGRAALSKR